MASLSLVGRAGRRSLAWSGNARFSRPRTPPSRYFALRNPRVGSLTQVLQLTSVAAPTALPEIFKFVFSQLVGVRSVENPEKEARLLIALAAKKDPNRLMPHTSLAQEEYATLLALIERRQSEEPVAYIRGTKEFWSLEFKVTPDCLIPRPATETVVEQALKYLKRQPSPSILDIGTGTGCIAISIIKSLLPQARATAVATDMDGKTLEVAKMNAITHGVESQVRFVRTNWAEALLQEASKFDLIVSNPPYLTPEELSCIEPTVSKFEPWRGLVGGRDGLSAYKAIASQAQHLLNGALILEIGNTQRVAVSEIFERAGFGRIECVQDIEGHDRCLIIQRG